MSSAIGQREVVAEEWVARFLFRREHIRQDKTVKPDPFIPYRHVELSLTRHTGLNDGQIWGAGKVVADQTGKVLRGRGDTQVATFIRQKLKVEAAPLPENANHANAVGWPPEKEKQKLIAIELVKEVRLVQIPIVE